MSSLLSFVSSRSASTSSLSFRSKLRSGVRRSAFTTCWVIVLPPCTTW